MSTFERALWRDIEVVITGGLENRLSARARGFESLSPLTVLRSQRDEFLVQN